MKELRYEEYKRKLGVLISVLELLDLDSSESRYMYEALVCEELYGG